MSINELTHWVTTVGDFQLQRYTPDPTRSLRAWDAADEYLANVLIERNIPGLTAGLTEAEAAGSSKLNCLILNDEFGALTTVVSALNANAAAQPISLEVINDSFVGRRAMMANLVGNTIETAPVINAQLPSTGSPFDLVLLKIPKSRALLEDQLIRLKSRVTPSTLILSAAMIKHLPLTVKPLLETLIGPTSLSRAVKKARFMETRPDATLPVLKNPYPVYHQAIEFNEPLVHHAGVFSLKHLDYGSVFLAEHIPTVPSPRTILDLGCGSGLLGLVAAKMHPEAEIIFVDESAAAVQSSEENWERLFRDREATFKYQDCLDPLPTEPVDLILCNPPFHEKFHLSTLTAERMFTQSREALAPGGRMLVVGNRQLDWGTSLNRIFGRTQQIAQNKKFVLHLAFRR